MPPTHLRPTPVEPGAADPPAGMPASPQPAPLSATQPVSPAGATELTQLQDQVEATRVVLIRLLQDVVAAEARQAALASATAEPMREANSQLVIAALQARGDADSAAAALQRASRSAELDALTQLPNRVLLRDRLAQAIASIERKGGRLALLFVDLDRFKQINDRLGHAGGDAVLQQLAQRLAASVRAMDTVSRHGGDEFVILLAEIGEPADAAHMATKLIASLRLPLALPHVPANAIGMAAGEAPPPAPGRPPGLSSQPVDRIGPAEPPLQVSASIGISLYPDDGADVDALIALADAAMYRAKRRGNGQFEFAVPAPTPGVADPGAGASAATGAGTAAATAAGATAPAIPPPAAVDSRLAQLRQANEQLVLAALGSRDLQAAADRARERQTAFMAALELELSNPLAPIRLATAMLGRVDDDTPLLPRARELIDRQVEQMSALVSRLAAAVHDVSLASAVARPADRQRVDLGVLIRAQVGLSQALFDARSQRLQVDLRDEPLWLLGQPERLTQVVYNLLDNACRYTPEGGAIHLRAARAGAQLTLTVSDSGIGIRAAALSQLFEPFVQDSAALGYNGAGLGIGLTVARTVVESHGGHIQAHSAGPGRGSEFTVTLPADLAPADAAMDAPTASSTASPTTSSTVPSPSPTPVPVTSPAPLPAGPRA